MLFDGWSLVFSPGSPPANHFFDLVEALPVGVDPWVALPVPGGSPQGQGLPVEHSAWVSNGENTPAFLEAAGTGRAVQPVYGRAANTPAGRLQWEQSTLPHLARRIQASRIHMLSLHAPLLSPAPVLISPAEDIFPGVREGSFTARVRSASGKGGLSRSRAVFWPGDLPYPSPDGLERFVDPWVHSAFFTPQQRSEALPENYVLVPGALDSTALQRLAATWSWAVGGLGDGWSLVACDLGQAQMTTLRALCRQSGIDLSPVSIPAPMPAERAALFQHCAAVLSIGPVHPWGDALLHALACARPVIAEETPPVNARVGPAAYLASPGDPRGLGAALITVLIDQEVSDQLCQAARTRTDGWDRTAIARRLSEQYQASE